MHQSEISLSNCTNFGSCSILPFCVLSYEHNIFHEIQLHEHQTQNLKKVWYAFMCVCMHVYMHACMYVCMYTCMYACMYVCIHVCVYACVCTRISFACVYVHACARIPFKCICVWIMHAYVVCMCVAWMYILCVYSCMHAHVYVLQTNTLVEWVKEGPYRRSPPSSESTCCHTAVSNEMHLHESWINSDSWKTAVGSAEVCNSRSGAARWACALVDENIVTACCA